MSEVLPNAPHPKTAGGVMGRVDGIEARFLKVVRIMAVIAVVPGVLAVGGAGLWYAVVHLTTSGTHGPSDYFENPTWKSIRHRVLPALPEQRASSESPAGGNEGSGKGPPPVDKRITRIADHLNAQFSRNAGEETGFTDRYPRRLLEAWVFGESGVPESYRAEYTNQLIAISETIGMDRQINRIGSIDDRARVIMEALDAFRLAFLARLEHAEGRAAGANALAAAKRAETARKSLYLGLGGLGLLVSLALIVVLLRIEVHLRKLARPERRRRSHGSGLRVMQAVALVSVCCAINSPNAFSDLNNCDFPIASDVGNEQSQTKDETEAELVQELAIKLRQFDRCLDREKTAASTPAGDSASQAADGGRAGVASSGNGRQNPGSGVEPTRPVGGAPGRPGDPIATVGMEPGTGRDGQNQGLPTGPATSGPVTGVPAKEGPGKRGESVRVPDNVVEDDVARILREAAARETDPTRRAALWKEYENYMNNL